MLSPEDELQERSGVNAEDRPCRNCGEPFDWHKHRGSICPGTARNTIYEPMDASDILSAEHPEEI